VSESGQGATKLKTIYLAGPEVFLPQAVELGRRKKQICREHGFDARFPLDVLPHTAGLDPSEIALRIFDICVEMMEGCDLVIANLTPFRSVSLDVGTAVEIGYLYAGGKPVFGYTNVVEDYADRVRAAGLSDGTLVVEDYGFCDNLMTEGAVRRSRGEVVRTRVSSDELFTALGGFETCVKQARQIVFPGMPEHEGPTAGSVVSPMG